LDLAAEEIRLLVFPATDHAAPLYVHFAHESIFGNVAYQCLSYVWGTGEPVAELTLNAKIVFIRRSLEQSLRHIRIDGIKQ